MNWHCKVSKNKTFEIQLDKFDMYSFFYLTTSWSRKQDHAGFEIWIEILGLALIIGIRDNRHWDDTNDRWQTYQN